MRNALWAILMPASLIYCCVAWLRRNFYPKRFQYQSKLKVVCVGNIHSGGSGKTPIVRELLCKGRFEQVVLTRGYGSQTTKTSDGAIYLDRNSQRGPAEFGDEPWMLSQEFDTPICLSKKRVRGIKRIETDYPKATVIMDDGFQHLALKRDLNIVCVNTDQKPEEGFCLPLGELREPYSALSDSQAIILIPGSDSDRLEFWKTWLATNFSAAPAVFSAVKIIRGLWNDKESCSLESKKKWFGFCGIAQPNRFVIDLLKECPNSQFLRAFPDHHAYSDAELKMLDLKVRESGAEGLVTTDKDWYKVKERFKTLGTRILRFKISYQLPLDFWHFYEQKLGLSELRGVS